MKLFILVFMVLFSQIMFADSGSVKPDPVKTVVSYLQGQPANIGGTITIDQTYPLYEESRFYIPFKMRTNKNEPIHFVFNEDYLEITGDKAIVLTVGGIPVKIKSAIYDAKTDKFVVKSDSPLGIGESRVNSEVESVLNAEYKPKLKQAALELKALRNKNQLKDIDAVMKSLSKIFSTGSGNPLPTVRGNVTLNFNPDKKQNLRLDEYNAEVQAGDNIGFTIDFVKSPNTFSIDSTVIRSYKGIRVSGDTKFPEIASVNFREVRIDPSGVFFDYDIGAEEVLTGLRLLLGLVRSYSGNDPRRVLYECDPVKIQSIRKTIDGGLKSEIQEMIRTNRAALLDSGANPALLKALEQ